MLQILSTSFKATIRQSVAEHVGFERSKGARNTVLYSAIPPPPSNPDVEEPSLQNLKFAWNQPVSHRYNKLASLLLAERFINDDAHQHLFSRQDAGLLRGIAKHIRAHVRYLSTVWQQQQFERTLVTAEDREYEQTRRTIVREAHAADHRRRLTLDRRGATASYYGRPSWFAVLNHAGAGSMSSDDLASDEEPPSARRMFYIVEKPWRSAELVEFLRLLDRLAEIVEGRTKYMGRVSRVRKHPAASKDPLVTTRPPNPNLNKEFYSDTQQTSFGPFHRYYTAEVDLAGALVE